MSDLQRTGKLFVVSAPSGAGKTSLVRALAKERPTLVPSVSHTTRAPRPHEVEGREYFFVSADEFQRLVRTGAFLEHARVFDNFYGTGAAQVRTQLAAGRDVLLEIDWQGAQQVRGAMPECVGIFILPPSRSALEQRLRERRTDSPETIARRLRDAVDDMSHYREFDYAIVNDRFDEALRELGAIIDGKGGELRADRPELAPLLRRLLRE
jgi:guanylate kinase